MNFFIQSIFKNRKDGESGVKRIFLTSKHGWDGSFQSPFLEDSDAPPHEDTDGESNNGIVRNKIKVFNNNSPRRIVDFDYDETTSEAEVFDFDSSSEFEEAWEVESQSGLGDDRIKDDNNRTGKDVVIEGIGEEDIYDVRNPNSILSLSKRNMYDELEGKERQQQQEQSILLLPENFVDNPDGSKQTSSRQGSSRQGSRSDTFEDNNSISSSTPPISSHSSKESRMFQQEDPNGNDAFTEHPPAISVIEIDKKSSSIAINTTYDRKPERSLFRGDDPNYVPISDWIGRLIFHRNERTPGLDNGVSIEIEHAPKPYQNLIGHILPLRWDLNNQMIRDYVKLTMRDVFLTEKGRKKMKTNELLKPPTRLHDLQGVGPLESLAGARAEDDVHVILPSGAVDVVVKMPSKSHSVKFKVDDRDAIEKLRDCMEDGDEEQDYFVRLQKMTDESSDPQAVKPTIYLQDIPIQVSGVYYCVVIVLEQKSNDVLRVRHFNAATGKFDGPITEIRYPHAQKHVFTRKDSAFPSTNINIDKSPENRYGWYFYGNFVTIGTEDTFVVKAIEPFRALSLNPGHFIKGSSGRNKSPSCKDAFHFIEKQNYERLKHRVGTTSTTLIDLQSERNEHAVASWKEGDRMIVVHTYGGVKSDSYDHDKKAGFFVAGHFSYGYATVIRDKLTNQLRLDIDHIQVYGTTPLGAVSGAQKRQCFLGCLHLGVLGLRPVSDCLVKLDLISKDFKIGEDFICSPWQEFKSQLHIMTARYRVGDGEGIKDIVDHSNCSQDSNQSLYVAIDKIEDTIVRTIKEVKRRQESEWDFDEVIDEESSNHLQKLRMLGSQLNKKLAPLGIIRADWEQNAKKISKKKKPNLVSSVLSYKTVLPRRAFDAVLKVFLLNDAKLWFITTVAVGGENESVVPLKPKKLIPWIRS